MKFPLLIFFIFLISSLHAQNATYSKYESNMISFAKNGLITATRYDSMKIAETTLDSCWKFIKKYPNSFSKPNIFSFMLEMTLLLSNDKNKIYPLIDSVLSYNRTTSTRFNIAKILIENNLDIRKGRNFISDLLPLLENDKEKYLAYITMARADIALGYSLLSLQEYKKAMQIEPNNLSGWYEYLSCSKINETLKISKFIESKIKELESKNLEQYSDEATKGKNINKDVSHIILKNLSGKVVSFEDFKGKVMLVNHFGFWCGWCINEFPIFKKIIKIFPKVVFVFVNFGDKIDEIRDIYLSKPQFRFLKNHFLLLFNKKYASEIYGHSFPQTLLIDKKGKVRFDYIGYDKNLERLLKKDLTILSKE